MHHIQWPHLDLTLAPTRSLLEHATGVSGGLSLHKILIEVPGLQQKQQRTDVGRMQVMVATVSGVDGRHKAHTCIRTTTRQTGLLRSKRGSCDIPHFVHIRQMLKYPSSSSP
jgi:hypothetical protein